MTVHDTSQPKITSGGGKGSSGRRALPPILIALTAAALGVAGYFLAARGADLPGRGTDKTAGGGARAQEAAPLTTTALRRLPPLPETDVIKPTGKVYERTITIKESRQEIAPGVTVKIFAFDGQVPGPTLRFTEGDTVRITFKNELKEPTAIHFHGMHLPNAMDGVPPLTQNPIKPGESFTYEFVAPHAGTYMYHSHLNSIAQIDAGMYGALIIDPQNPEGQPKFDKDEVWVLSAWTGMDAGTDMKGMNHNQGDMGYIYYTINGKAYPLVKPLQVKKGDVVRLRLINISNLVHPMHLHGHDFRVIAKDGHPVKDPQVMNTLTLGPGDIYDIEFIADNPGVWVFHCHQLHHTVNNGVEPGGLIGVVAYEGAQPLGDAAASDQKPAAGAGQANQGQMMMQGMDHSQMNMPGMDHSQMGQ